MDRTKEEKLREIGELIDIPQFERILHHKIKELKLYLKDEIDHYRELKENYKKLAYGKMEIMDNADDTAVATGTDTDIPAGEPKEEAKEPKKATEATEAKGSSAPKGNGKRDKRGQTYYFELHKGRGDEWNVSAMEPPLPDGYDFADIIPEELAESIARCGAAPGESETINDLSLPSLTGVEFDIHFTKYSRDHILGTISCYQTRLAMLADDIPQKIYNFTKKSIEESTYDEIVYYMKKYPPVREFFLNEFHMKMKPLIEGNMVDVIASSRPLALV